MSKAAGTEMRLTRTASARSSRMRGDEGYSLLVGGERKGVPSVRSVGERERERERDKT